MARSKNCIASNHSKFGVLKYTYLLPDTVIFFFFFFFNLPCPEPRVCPLVNNYVSPHLALSSSEALIIFQLLINLHLMNFFFK